MHGTSLTHAFWMTSANFGDNLNHYVLSRLSKNRLVFTGIELPTPKVVAIGSILNWCNEHTIAWGCGLAAQTDCVNPATKIAAVRGPRSWKRAVDCGIKAPEVFGDPALLLPRVYTPTKSLAPKMAIIPHYVDQANVFGRYAAEANKGMATLVDVLAAPEVIIDQIVSAEYVISSSLHGIIVAYAYGIPAAWVTFGGTIGGDGMKYHDHFEAVGLRVQGVVDVRDMPNLDVMASRCGSYFELQPVVDVKPLLAAAPFALR